MKTIGFLGGMSWESTLVYYRFINEEVRKILGDSHSARIIIHSFDFYRIKELQDKHDWTSITAPCYHPRQKRQGKNKFYYFQRVDEGRY